MLCYDLAPCVLYNTDMADFLRLKTPSMKTFFLRKMQFLRVPVCGWCWRIRVQAVQPGYGTRPPEPQPSHLWPSHPVSSHAQRTQAGRAWVPWATATHVHPGLASKPAYLLSIASEHWVHQLDPMGQAGGDHVAWPVGRTNPLAQALALSGSPCGQQCCRNPGTS